LPVLGALILVSKGSEGMPSETAATREGNKGGKALFNKEFEKAAGKGA